MGERKRSEFHCGIHPRACEISYFCLDEVNDSRKSCGDTHVDERGPLINLRSPGPERKQAHRGSDRKAPPGQVLAGVPAQARDFLSDSLTLALGAGP